MAEHDTHKSLTQWKIIAGIAIAALIAYVVYINFKAGITVRKVSVPGMMELEFADRQGLGSVAEPGKTDESGLRENQTRLETKLAELEDRLAERGSAPPPEPDEIASPEDSSFGGAAAAPGLQGQWFSPQGLTYIVQQRGDYVTLQEFNPLLGITAVGEGRIRGTQLELSYSTAVGTFGQATLQLSEDGSTLWGQSRDVTTGLVMNMQLQR